MSTGTHAVVPNPAALDLLSVTTTQVIPTIPADAPRAEGMSELVGNPAALADEDCVRCGGETIHCPICMNCGDQCLGHAAAEPARTVLGALRQRQDAQTSAPPTHTPPSRPELGLVQVPFHAVAGAFVELGTAFGDLADLVFVERGGLTISDLKFLSNGTIGVQATRQIRDLEGSEAQRCGEVERLARLVGAAAHREPIDELADWYVATRIFGERLSYVVCTRIAPLAGPADPFAGVAWEAERQALAADQLLVDERLAAPGAATLPSESAPVR